jgi:hypothetical protein
MRYFANNTHLTVCLLWVWVWQSDSSELRRQLSSVSARVSDADSQLSSVRRALQLETDAKAQALARLTDATADAEQLVRALEGVQKQLTAYKAREVELIRHGQAQAEAVGAAELARDQALQRETSAKEMVQKLTERYGLVWCAVQYSRDSMNGDVWWCAVR